MKVDAHHHLWSLARGDYGWLTPALAPIYRDFGMADLAPLLDAHGIAGTVLVQAAPTQAETRFLLDIAAREGQVKGVVGWVDFEAPDAPAQIAALAAAPKLVGLRPMIQDIAEDDWMLGAALRLAFAAMVAHGLVFDALTLPRHLPNLRRLLAQHPKLRVVIDHASKPEIAERAFDDWAHEMAALARETGAVVKLSGLVTEAGPGWEVADLQPYTDHLLATFGPERMIWGSDWPVCLLASDYARWCAATETLLAGLDAPARAAIWGETAQRVYGL